MHELRLVRNLVDVIYCEGIRPFVLLSTETKCRIRN